MKEKLGGREFRGGIICDFYSIHPNCRKRNI
jgi:hypothetical protein